MSEFKPRKLQEVKDGEHDIIRGAIPETAEWSVSLQNATPDVRRDFNAYYICTKGAGFSIEIQGKLAIGKFDEETLRESLEGRIYLTSSIAEKMAFSSTLAEFVKNSWSIERKGNQYLLVTNHNVPNSDVKGKVIKIWGTNEPIRPLAPIVHWETHGAYRVCDLTPEGLEDFRERHSELNDDEWPAPGESIVLLLHGEKVHVTHEDHINIINHDFFKTGLED